MVDWYEGTPEQIAAKKKAIAGVEGKPTPTPTPTKPKKETFGLSLFGDITKNIGKAITGKEDGEKLSILERIQKGTTAARNLVLALATGAILGKILNIGKAAKAVPQILRSGAIPQGVFSMGTSAGRATAIRAAEQAKYVTKITPLMKNLLKKAATGDVIFRKAASFIYNAKTARLVQQHATKAVISSGFPAKTALLSMAYIGSTVGSVGWGYWGYAEAMRESDFAYQSALKTGDKELIASVKAIRDAVGNEPNFAKKVFGWMLQLTPAAALPGIQKKANAAVAQRAVTDFLVENPGTDNIGQDIIETKKATIELQAEAKDESDAKTIAREEALIELRAEAKTTSDKATLENINNQIALWAASAENQRKLDIENAEKLADFWLAYLARKLEIKESMIPSNLKFGLL